MKQNTKGFTLIELLAVIVVLAIIALIATPIVLNLIDQARKGAAESDAYAYVKAVETSAVVKMMSTPNLNLAGTTCTVGTDAKTISCKASGETAATELTLEIKGTLPASGDTITLGTDGSVASANLNVGGYKVYVGSNGTATVTSEFPTTTPGA